MAYDAEKQALRELANWVLPQFQCWFCKEPFINQKDGERQGFGHRRHRAVNTDFTFHHRDENRENNVIALNNGQLYGNVVIAHPHCHRKHHNQKRREEKLSERTTS